jgi:hypothetical protein
MTERAMLTIRRLLNWLALFCLVGFFFPYYQNTTIQGVSEKTFTLGVPFSPWLIASWKETEATIEKNEDGTIRSVHSGGFSSGVNAEWISWSSLFGITGFVLLEVSRRLHPKATSQGS